MTVYLQKRAFQKPVDNIALNISFSPPVHWTFCFPSCGVNDQAVDEDDAYEKAKDDVLDAVSITITQNYKITLVSGPIFMC